MSLDEKDQKIYDCKEEVYLNEGKSVLSERSAHETDMKCVQSRDCSHRTASRSVARGFESSI